MIRPPFRRFNDKENLLDRNTFVKRICITGGTINGFLEIIKTIDDPTPYGKIFVMEGGGGYFCTCYVGVSMYLAMLGYAMYLLFWGGGTFCTCYVGVSGDVPFSRVYFLPQNSGAGRQF